ncbi:hypothetical protein RHSIM_Rhsim11G0006400 [Rhododendron simsii]|uniref:Endonuclease/exonuclease/phosphatase domain-containing protein n=1 Tax=Rhododendron simsii TaxID=118357 RepID=A0A834GDG2_RHOSS|nr:hypothetical protein RHSIM_Rhsim11G0006400 [Rhododendron simsii]
MDNLSRRRPETHEQSDIAAREEDVMVERVRTPSIVQGQQMPGMEPSVFSIRFFDSLTVKRKAQDELLDQKNSKILRLCSLDINPSPNLYNLTTPSHKICKSVRNPKPPSRGKSLSSTLVINEQGLCEVQIRGAGGGGDQGWWLARNSHTLNVSLNLELLRNGRTLTSQGLGDLVRKNCPSVVFLMETKNNKAKLVAIHHCLKFDSSSYVELEGLSGGLALWWNKEVELAAKNFFHVIVTDKSVFLCWVATFVYGCPMRSGRTLVWENIIQIARSEKFPWLCMGDFNQVLRVEDKLEGLLLSQSQISAFHEMISECGLVDLEYKGTKFTWKNNRNAESFIMEPMGSDHNPLLLNMAVPLNKVDKPFRFESFWVTYEESKEVIKTAWNQGCDGSPMKVEIAALERSLSRQMEDLWQKDAMYWHQRSRIKWLKMGNRNSRFFHLSTIQRRQRNQIMRLKDNKGVWRNDTKEIAGLIKAHFKELYKEPLMRDFEDIISLVDTVISPECDASLVKEIHGKKSRMLCSKWIL